MTLFGFTPARRRGIELLDDPSADPALAIRSLRDVSKANRFFGGTNAVLSELHGEIARAAADGRELTLLDVGTGAGDIPERARALARRTGVRLHSFGLEISTALARSSLPRSGTALVGDALALPFASHSVDIVTCSQVLHHFVPGDAACLISEMHRVARRRAVIADLRRSWGAAAGLWLSSWLIGFHPVSRHDGVVSVLRGFRLAELARAVQQATGQMPAVRNRRGFRVTASWTPA